MPWVRSSSIKKGIPSEGPGALRLGGTGRAGGRRWGERRHGA
jgi:hypothetical protein